MEDANLRKLPDGCRDCGKSRRPAQPLLRIDEKSPSGEGKRLRRESKNKRKFQNNAKNKFPRIA